MTIEKMLEQLKEILKEHNIKRNDNIEYGVYYDDLYDKYTIPSTSKIQAYKECIKWSHNLCEELEHKLQTPCTITAMGICDGNTYIFTFVTKITICNKNGLIPIAIKDTSHNHYYTFN